MPGPEGVSMQVFGFSQKTNGITEGTYGRGADAVVTVSFLMPGTEKREIKMLGGRISRVW